jgi:2-dehydropantoate 2-reductase
VTLVARGAQFEAIRQDGLRLEAPGGTSRVDVPVVDDARALGEVDTLVVATKTWQLETAGTPLADRLGPGTTVFGIQNGVEHTDVLARALPAAHVLGGTCRIISLVTGPGVIMHVGAEPTIVLGQPGGGPSGQATALAAALDLGPTLRTLASEDIDREIWRKFLFFAPGSGMGSITRAPIGVFRSEAGSRQLLEAAVHEVVAVGRACGVDLPAGSAAEALAYVDSLPESGTSSMQRDFEAGRRTELDALAGAVVRLGRTHQVPTPVLATIHAALEPLERRARGELSW